MGGNKRLKGERETRRKKKKEKEKKRKRRSSGVVTFTGGWNSENRKRRGRIISLARGKSVITTKIASTDLYSRRRRDEK